MADWYGHARSNYFCVKDLDAFRKAMERLDLKVVGGNPDNSVDETGHVALLSVNDDKGGWPSSIWNEDEDEDEDVDVADLVAQHLVEGEVAVFMECGAEKLRYVTGVARAINSKGDTRTVSLDDIYDLAKELGPNVTQASY